MKTKILILTFFLYAVVSAVAAQTEISLYHAPINYDEQSFRKDGKTTGLYAAYRSASGYVWEGAVENTQIDYVENTQIDYELGTDLDQTDVTLALTRHWQSSHAYRFGLHAISSDDTDEAFTLFAGFSRYHPYDDSYGGSVYYSHYPNIDLQVWQAVPKVGKYLGDPITTGTFLIQGKLNLIAIEDGNTYFSAEGEVSWYYGDVSLSLGAWGGTQLCAVRDDGFVVYNSADKHTGGVTFQAGYALTDNTRLNISIDQEQVTETTGTDTEVTVYSLSLKHTF
ncbi:hypothetical protein PN36_10590 [Candidatus Thiomargarita nelsonii]|uniref:Secreted protein n=1 Tax=Candidatus Thiomargarita nelsonii TaxID=1003181 RepID=A0A0A6PQN9_9GAMM|nr:hypothetical protein PN36_10590 [Candidatus Thiomargarita nelsonii]